MSDNWDFYFCRVNDILSSIFVDLGARESAPDPARGHLLWIWIPFQRSRPDGLSSAEEAETLAIMEDEFAQKLERELDAVFVGRITGAGRRELYYYAAAAGEFESIVSQVSAGYPAYDFDFGEQADATWSQYREVLYPSPSELQRIRNRRVVEALEAAGDSLEMARPVKHWIYFGNAAQRATGKERLAGASFQVDDVDAGDATRETAWGLCATRVHKVDPDSVDTHVQMVLDLLEDLDAEYDGWESPVVQAPRPSGSRLSRFFGRRS